MKFYDLLSLQFSNFITVLIAVWVPLLNTLLSDIVITIVHFDIFDGNSLNKKDGAILGS